METRERHPAEETSLWSVRPELEKTEIARRLAQLARAPFVKVEATKFTEVGYVGRGRRVDGPWTLRRRR